MNTFHMDIPGLNGFVQRFKGADKIVSEEMATAGKKSGLAVERLGKLRARVWRGLLRQSVTSSQSPFGTIVTPLIVTTKIGSTLPYAPVRDRGRSPGATPPPVAPIAAWLASKGKDPRAAFAVARAIGRRGIPGDHFLTGAFDQLKPQIRQEFDQVPKRVIARLRGGG
jgi:hypothetical protein